MSKIERLNARVAKLLTVAVHEVLEVVRETVSEYQEKTARTQRENESLRRRLQELQDKVKRVSPAGAHLAALPVSGGKSLVEQQHCEQEWSSSLEQDTELTLTGEKLELTEEHVNEQREEEGSELESDHMAESEIDCDILVSRNSILGSDCVSPKIDAALSVYISHPVISNSLSPNTSSLDILPSLSSDDIKVEQECETSQQNSSQNAFYNHIDSSCTTTQNRLSNQDAQQVKTVSYEMVHMNSNHISFGKRFVMGKNRSSLDIRKHLQCHWKEEQHRCILCGKTFRRVGDLRIHQRCHTGERPYSCMQCNRCFSKAGDLTKHKRVHTGEKPYLCTQCGRSFSRRENLKRHQKVHVGKTSYPH